VTAMEEPQDSRWRKGQSGNPNGRAAGSRNRATLAIEALLGEGEALTRKAIELAKAGDKAGLTVLADLRTGSKSRITSIPHRGMDTFSSPLRVDRVSAHRNAPPSDCF
jgi:hypothetical protein